MNQIFIQDILPFDVIKIYEDGIRIDEFEVGIISRCSRTHQCDQVEDCSGLRLVRRSGGGTRCGYNNRKYFLLHRYCGTINRVIEI